MAMTKKTTKAAKAASKKTTKAAGKKTVKTVKAANAKKTAAKAGAKKPVKKVTAKKTAAKKSLSWGFLPFGYMKTDKRFVSNFKNGKWDAGKLTGDDKVVISECAGVLQYSQSCFEGLKAYTTEDGRIVTFRPDLNGERMEGSCKRLEMPVFPKDKFVKAVIETIKANKQWVPPYGSGATLYVRPYMFGSSAVIGVKPADEYQFRIFVTPVGPYFKGGVKPITVRMSDLDRAAPRGTGNIKAGLNYAMSLYNIVDAHKNGFSENMYTDPATHTYIEETGGANILFVTKEGTIVTPKSDSILPSITRRSLIYVAQNYLHIPVEERKVNKDELPSFMECGLCGTAAVISPIGKVVDHDKEIVFPGCKDKMGPVLQKLYDTLTGIQMGHIEAPKGWLYEIR
jgi:branched-chain amino acid aminotransferase